MLERTLKSAYRCVDICVCLCVCVEEWDTPLFLIPPPALYPWVDDTASLRPHFFILLHTLSLSHTPAYKTPSYHSARFGVEAECFVTTPGTGAGVVDLKKEEERRQLLLSGRGGRRGRLLVYLSIGAYETWRWNGPPVFVCLVRYDRF